MKLVILVLAGAAVLLAPKAAAAATPAIQDAAVAQGLQLRPKAAMPTPAKVHRFAPFVAPLDEPDPELLPRIDPRNESSHWSCTGETSLCYDPNSRRIIYKPARALMPDIPGLHRENISVRRDRVTFKYSF